MPSMLPPALSALLLDPPVDLLAIVRVQEEWASRRVTCDVW